MKINNRKSYLAIRLLLVVIAVIGIGFSLSWLIPLNLGIDAWTMTNIAIADTLGVSLGSFQAVLNIVLLAAVVILGANNLGFGTLANMFLVGYSIDFFSWIWSLFIPEEFFELWFVRIGILIPALALFVLSVAIYIDMDMGTSPYDAIPSIIAKHLPKIPYRIIRICYDGVAAVIGILFGGRIGIVTVLMILTLGPVITWVGNKIKGKWNFSTA